MTYQSIQPPETSTETELEDLSYPACLLSLTEEMGGDSIFSLDSSSRTAFLLHHWLGNKIEDAALLLDITESEFRARLRSAYLQLCPCEFSPGVHLSEIPAEPALA